MNVLLVIKTASPLLLIPNPVCLKSPTLSFAYSLPPFPRQARFLVLGFTEDSMGLISVTRIRLHKFVSCLWRLVVMWLWAGHLLPQFPHLPSGDNGSPCPVRQLWGLNEPLIKSTQSKPYMLCKCCGRVSHFCHYGSGKGFPLSQLAYLYLWGCGCDPRKIYTRILFAHTMTSCPPPVGHDFISLILVWESIY